MVWCISQVVNIVNSLIQKIMQYPVIPYTLSLLTYSATDDTSCGVCSFTLLDLIRYNEL